MICVDNRQQVMNNHKLYSSLSWVVLMPNRDPNTQLALAFSQATKSISPVRLYCSTSHYDLH